MSTESRLRLADVIREVRFAVLQFEAKHGTKLYEAMRRGVPILSESRKRVSDLSPEDVGRFPVWEYTNADEMTIDETIVQPVVGPVDHLSNRLVGTQVRLANGQLVSAIVGNVDIDDPRSTKHFLTLSVFSGRRSFDLARYHDVDSEERGPLALAAFLDLSVDDVFPIEYDLRPLVDRDAASLHGVIERVPRERLTASQLIKLSLK